MYESLTYTLPTGEELLFERFGRVFMAVTRWCGKNVILIAESDPYTDGVCKHCMETYSAITDNPEDWEQPAIEYAVRCLADRAADRAADNLTYTSAEFSGENFSTEAFAADLVISEIHLHPGGAVTFCFTSTEVLGEHIIVLVRGDTVNGSFYGADILE